MLRGDHACISTVFGTRLKTPTVWTNENNEHNGQRSDDVHAVNLWPRSGVPRVDDPVDLLTRHLDDATFRHVLSALVWLCDQSGCLQSVCHSDDDRDDNDNGGGVDCKVKMVWGGDGGMMMMIIMMMTKTMKMMMVGVVIAMMLVMPQRWW